MIYRHCDGGPYIGIRSQTTKTKTAMASGTAPDTMCLVPIHIVRDFYTAIPKTN